MTGPVSKNPEGFLDLFGIKGPGRYPAAVADFIQPEYSVAQLLNNFHSLSGVAAFANLVATAGAASFAITSAQWLSVGFTDFADGGVTTTVPFGEIWIVEEAQVLWLFSGNAGNSCDAGLFVRRANVTHLLTDSVLHGNAASSASATLEGHRCMTRKFVMLPGDELRVAHYGIVVAAGSVTWNGAVRIRRLTR
jgi:hypothetical protein